MDLLELLSSDDRIPAYLELEKDLAFPHLSSAEILHYIDQSLELGRSSAAAYQGLDPFELARDLGAHITICRCENTCAGVTIRAEYEAATRTIKLYRNSIEEVRKALAVVPGESWTYEQVAAWHLAHELFHHLEATRLGPVHEQLPAVTIFRLGPLWTTRTRVRQCREIAAQAFARKLLNLPFLPSVVDWLVLLSQEQWTPSAAIERLLWFRARFSYTVTGFAGFSG